MTFPAHASSVPPYVIRVPREERQYCPWKVGSRFFEFPFKVSGAVCTVEFYNINTSVTKSVVAPEQSVPSLLRFQESRQTVKSRFRHSHGQSPSEPGSLTLALHRELPEMSLMHRGCPRMPSDLHSPFQLFTKKPTLSCTFPTKKEFCPHSGSHLGKFRSRSGSRYSSRTHLGMQSKVKSTRNRAW